MLPHTQNLLAEDANPPVTLECLLHMLTDLDVEDSYMQNMDRKGIDQYKSVIQRALQSRKQESQERQDQAMQLVDEILRVHLDRRSRTESDWSTQHDVRTKSQQVRYLLGETYDMDIQWSMVEFHEEGFLTTDRQRQLRNWCWATFPFKVYYNSIRLRGPYMCWITVVLSFSVFAGLLCETFMSTFTPLTGTVATKKKLIFHGYLILLPCFLLFFSFFCEGAMVLAFDSAKTVPLIKFEATLLQGLRFLTLPRFCVLIVWGSTSAVSFQHLRFMFTQMNYISDQDSKLELQVKMFVGKLCLVVILVVIMIVFMVVMQPGFIKECRKKFLEEDSHETKGMLLVCYCIALGYFLVWKDDTQVIWTMLLGFVGAVIMAWFNPSQEQSWVPILWRRQVVDFVFIFLVEVVPLVSGIWGCFFWGHTSDGRGPLGAFWRSYVWGAVFSVMIATATFQTCNVYIAGKVILSEITAKTEAGILQRPFRHRAEFEVQRKLEAMFHRDRVPPGILAQVPESLFQSAVKEVEQSALSFPAYAKHQELSDNGVPVWKYFWYLAFACILGATLFVVQGLDSSNGEQSFNTMIRTALVCSPFFIILFGFKYFPIHARKCLKRLCFKKTGYLDLDKFVKHQTDVWSPLIVVFVLYIVLVFASFFGEFYGMDAKAWIPGVCPCFLLVAAFASLAVEKKAPPLINSSYWKLIWLFALVITVIMIIPIFQLPHAGASVPIVGKIDTAYDRKTRAEDYRYDLCNWIHGPASLTALDMATFAGLTYETDNEKIKQKLSIVFSGRDLNMTGSLPEEYPRYVVFDIGTEEKTRVIAIKGTSTPKDIYMDIALFAVIEILQFLEFVFPIIDLFPTDQIQWLLYRAHLFSQREVEKDFWDTTTANISSRWVTNQSTSNTILTGHSLGGLMAQVIAARLNLPAFVFSSPGVKYSATRFGIHDAHYWMKYTPGERPGVGEFGVEVLKAKVRNVIPDEDLVPRVDKQIGIVDRIECRDGLTKTDAKENERPMTFQCHMLTRTSCELWRACGDIYKRKFNCGAYHYGPKDIGEWETPDDNE